MSLIGCYLDESSDEKQQEIFAVAGLLGHLVNWFEVERAWEKRLAQDGLPYFRAVDCENVRGPFASFRANRNSLKYDEQLRAEAIRTDLIEIMRKNQLLGVGVGMIMRDFNEVSKNPIARKVLSLDPYHLTYKLVLTRIADTIKNEFPHHIVACVCDQDKSHVGEALRTYQLFMQRNPDIAPFLGTLTYADDRAVAPLQAADLIAYETMHKARRWLKGIEEDRLQFQKLKGVTYRIDACDKAALLRLVEQNKQYTESP